MMKFQLSSALFAAFMSGNALAFTQPSAFGLVGAVGSNNALMENVNAQQSTSRRMSSFDEDFMQETKEQTQQRIKDLVEENPVLLFMKGSKLFPQVMINNTIIVFFFIRIIRIFHTSFPLYIFCIQCSVDSPVPLYRF